MGIPGMTAGSRKKERKKKPDELLSSVVRETAVPAAVELLRANTPFVFPSGTAYVMLVLEAEAIGGLSKRDGRNEAKGSIIELISSDQIHTVATAEMLAEEVFGIIPTEETLARMDEYSLLTDARYSWAVVWQKPSGELLVDLVNDASFQQAQDVSAGRTELKEAVGPEAWREHSGVADEEDDTEDPRQAVSEVETAETDAVVDEGDPIFDDVPDDGTETGLDDEPVFEDAGGDAPEFIDEPDEDDSVSEPAVESVQDEVESLFEEDDAGYGVEDDQGDAADEAEPILADQSEVRDVIARRFLSEDLDLDIRLDEFNTTFAIGAPVVQIAVPEGATEWLGDQVAQLNRQANADLAQLRFAHEDELRSLYVSLMSEHVEQVIRDVATDRDGSQYKALKEAAESEHQQRVSEKEEKIRKRRSEIVEDYEKQAKKMAEQAAIQAEIQYKERNRSKLEREQADAVAGIERDLEDSHSRDQQEILAVRRQHADLKLQTGQTRIFAVLRERQQEFLAAEEERLGVWKDEIQRIVDDNRKADIAQYEALAEHQRTTDEIGDLRREQDERIEAMRSEHADRLRRMEEELERSRTEAVSQMKARDEEWQHSLNLEKEKTDSETKRAADLFAQLEMNEEAVGKRYQRRIADLEADKESYANAMARADSEHSRSTKFIVLLLIGLPLLTGVAGWIGGVGMAG